MKYLFYLIASFILVSCSKNCIECKWKEYGLINGNPAIKYYNESYCEGSTKYELVKSLKLQNPNQKYIILAFDTMECN